MLGRKVDAEVQSLLAIGHARSKLAFERKPAAPCAPAPFHRDCLFCCSRKGEEATTRAVEGGNDIIADAMAPHIEKTGVAASRLDLCSYGGLRRDVVPAHQRGDVNDRQRHAERRLPGSTNVEHLLRSQALLKHTPL